MKKQIASLIFAFSVLFSAAGESALALRLTDLSGGLTEEEIKGLVEPKEEEEEGATDEDKERSAVDPVIESIVIQGNREIAGAKVNLTGKNLLPTKGSVSVSFPGGSVSSFSYQSSTLLIFELPSNVTSGNVTVSTTGENGWKRTSDPYPFEFHPPEILFVTGKDGIGPGKTIQVWGNYLDGIFYRKDNRSKLADVKNGYLQGADISADGNLSVIELKLPEKNYNKEFWVERNCDSQGNNCLKSNKISFENAIPPVLTELQIDYQNWEATIYGKNFPEESGDLSISFGDSSVSKKYYSQKEGKTRFSLPCPLPAQAVVEVSYKGINSNPLLFQVYDAPAIIDSVLSASPVSTGKSRLEVSVNDRLDLPSTDVCTTDSVLYVNSMAYSLRKYGGKYITDDIDTDDIPTSAEMYVVFRGVKSDTIPFSRSTHSLSPKIFRIESKYGFRPGTIFSIYGRNMGNEYNSCGVGETKINGVDVISEEIEKRRVGTNEDGEPIYENICHRNPPDVTPTVIEAQFKPLAYGSRSSFSEKTVSVSAAGKSSNSLVLPFGDVKNNTVNIVRSAPEIRTIEYPAGHLPGSEIIIRGNEFGVQEKHNIITIGGKEVYPSSANSRGTELRVKIPKGVISGNVTVFRKTPDPQQSEPFEVVVSPHEEKQVLFAYEENGEPEDITVEGSEYSFSFPKISYINSSGSLEVNRFQMEIEWEDGDPEDDYSLRESKIAPFGVFTLQLGGGSVSQPTIANVSRNRILLDFLPFEMPLTTSESDSLVLKTSVLPTVTDGSRFRLKFSPKNTSHFLALNTETGRGVLVRPDETLVLPWITVKKTDDDRCIDTSSSNAHCDEYLNRQEQNLLFSQQKNQESEKDKKQVEKELSREEKVEQILSRLEREKERRVQEILEKKQKQETEKVDEVIEKNESTRKEKAAFFLKKYGREKAEKILRILEKQDRIHAQKIGKSSEEIKKQRELLDEKQKKQQLMKQVIDSDLPLAKRLFTYRFDDDKDGLSNAEELIIGTDPEMLDTDRDGYSDFVEVEFGISPLKRSTEKVFSDISQAGSHASAISRLSFFDVLPDFSEDSFRPDDAVTRSFFVAVLANIFVGTEWDDLRESPYGDVSKEDWFAPHLVAAKEMGVDLEILSDSFRPYDTLTRKEACAMVYPLIRHKKYPKAEQFEDVFREFKDSIGACFYSGILQSVDDVEQESEEDEELIRNFGVDEYLTRAEMATMLYRMIFIRLSS